MFRIVGCAGMARVDFFVTDEGVLVNELNTIPGFTATSVYAKLWDATGVPYPRAAGPAAGAGAGASRGRAQLPPLQPGLPPPDPR